MQAGRACMQEYTSCADSDRITRLKLSAPAHTGPAMTSALSTLDRRVSATPFSTQLPSGSTVPSSHCAHASLL